MKILPELEFVPRQLMLRQLMLRRHMLKRHMPPQFVLELPWRGSRIIVIKKKVIS